MSSAAIGGDQPFVARILAESSSMSPSWLDQPDGPLGRGNREGNRPSRGVFPPFRAQALSSRRTSLKRLRVPRAPQVFAAWRVAATAIGRWFVPPPPAPMPGAAVTEAAGA
jgi:hypothetical protein